MARGNSFVDTANRIQCNLHEDRHRIWGLAGLDREDILGHPATNIPSVLLPRALSTQHQYTEASVLSLADPFCRRNEPQLRDGAPDVVRVWVRT